MAVTAPSPNPRPAWPGINPATPADTPGSGGAEVLVVGAGPTGLMAATLLARQGVAVRIVDQRPEASRESRAFAIQPRTMELFLSLGLAERFLERGVVNTGMEMFVRGRRAGRIDYDRAASDDTPFQFLVMLPQSQTEAILIDDLAAHGVEVERGVDVRSLTQDGAGVTTAWERDGRPGSVRSAFVVGADGAHSVVRKSQGIGFSGSAYPQSFLLADCRVDWKLDHSRFRVFLNAGRIGLFLPLDGSNLSRVMTTDLDGTAEDEAQIFRQLQAAFPAATGLDASLTDPVWVTRYRSHARMVDRYRQGRVFLAGDAAHIHSPAGGQGMNTGLQDAANLAWKMASVLRGQAGDAMLDSYERERLPVAQQVLSQTDRMFTLAAGQSGWRGTLRDAAARAVMGATSRFGRFNHRAFRGTAQLDISYRAAPGAGEARFGTHGPAVGRRAPDARIARGREVFDLIGGYGFHLLALSRTPMTPADVGRVRAALDDLAGRYGLSAHLVARVEAGRDDRVVFVESAAVFQAYGVAHDAADQALYLIRPDGYVAWRTPSLDTGAVAGHLAATRPDRSASTNRKDLP